MGDGYTAATGKQWQQGSFWGKYAGMFISTGTLGGGQESTAISAMSTLVHHGFIYVPLGYKTAFAQLANLEEIHGGSPWVSLILPRSTKFSC